MYVSHVKGNMTDKDSWKRYPQYHVFFNKLWVAEQMNYNCGPCGVEIPSDGTYIVRPIYNLDGMGRGASIKFMQENDLSTPPGYFWCEHFNGIHYSIDYKWHHASQEWDLQLAVIGTKQPGTIQFTAWDKIEPNQLPVRLIKPPKFVYSNNLQVPNINVEYIGINPIEIHLRGNPDFANHNFSHLDVIWSSSNTDMQYLNDGVFIEAKEQTDNDVRLGFYAT